MACGEGPKPGSLLLTLALTLLLLLSTASFARGEPAELEDPDDKATLVDCEKQERYASAKCFVEHAGSQGSRGRWANGGGGAPDICRFNGHEIPCTNAVGYWSNRVEAWCTLRVPQPPLSDSAWGGNTTGAIYLCTRPAHSGIPDPAMVVTRWLPAAPEAPDPETIAWRILAELDLESPELGVFPRGDSAQRMGFVGWNVWLWAAADSDRQWGPVSASQSEGGVSVSLTARVTSMTWDMGNGDTVSCGKGTAWTLAATGGKNVASPTCGYVYEADGRYTVRGSSTWEVAWSGGGQLGTIPLTLSREAEVIVGELQAVTVNR